MPRKYRMLIGGIGDDAHSVGIRFLALGFEEAGFYVRNLGIRNEIKVFFENAADFEIIMISNKNGHAELYLANFSKYLNQYNLTNDSDKLWYLGGSLSVSESDFHIKKKFLRMGFTNVYPKPISFQQTLNDVYRDINKYNIKKKEFYPSSMAQNLPKLNYVNFIDSKWSIGRLLDDRRIVLQEWHTGKNLLSVNNKWKPAGKLSLDNLLWKNKCLKGNTLLQPRTGVANLEDQILLLRYLERHGSDISSVQLDAASRSKKYGKASLGREMSKSRRNSVLNGFPLPVYEIDELTKMVNAVNTPFQLRGGGPDHKFTYELALGSGVSGLEGGFICYLMPYDKLTDPVESMKNWQYIDRLCAFYEEIEGITINREYFGVLTATLIEPSLAIVVNIIQAILSAQQGVKSISVGYSEQGNRSQDIAAVKVMDEMANHFLQKFGYKACRVTSVFHQFMAAFPSDTTKAESLIFNSAITANLAGATKTMIKTPVEAFKIPGRYDNARAIKLCSKALKVSHSCKVDSVLVDKEISMLKLQVQQLMEAITELGNGSVGLGSLKAIEEGIIDIPWSPNIYNKNQLISVRDIDGAIRFYNFANLPFSQEIKDFHHSKVYLRQTLERDSSIFSLIEKDLSRIWKNDYKAWPLDGLYVN